MDGVYDPLPRRSGIGQLITTIKNHICGVMVGMLAVDSWFVCQTKIL